jgi:hypothetical protein
MGDGWLKDLMSVYSRKMENMKSNVVASGVSRFGMSLEVRV